MYAFCTCVEISSPCCCFSCCSHPLLPGAFHRSSLPPFSHQISKQVWSGFLLCLKLLSSDLSTMFQLSKIPCRTFDLTDQKWFRSSYNILQHLKGCIFHEKSWNTCPHVLRAIVPNTINMHSLKMLSSFPELHPSWDQFAWLFKIHKTLEL